MSWAASESVQISVKQIPTKVLFLRGITKACQTKLQRMWNFSFFLLWRGETATPTQREDAAACLPTDFELHDVYHLCTAVSWLLVTCHPVPQKSLATPGFLSSCQCHLRPSTALTCKAPAQLPRPGVLGP